MSANLATAYVTILPSMKGMRKGISSELGGAAEEGKKGFLSRIGGLVPGVGKVAGIAGGLLTGAIAGVAVTGGFNRAMAIEQAQAKLSGLGHDTKNVEKIMDNASAAVKGTAYGLGDAATVAASAVAAGVKPGQELQDVLTLVGDAASIAGTDMGQMGAIFNKVKASNKLQMDSINQLHDAGIPALALVAERLGVTAEEASKMASSGEIDFATFAAAMQDGMGGAAQKSGETFTGALANTKAALGRIGETFLSPFLSAATVAMSEWAIPALDAINAALKPVMAGVGAALAGAVDLINSKLSTISEAPLVRAFSAIRAEVASFEGDWYSVFTAGELGYAVQQALGVGENHPIVQWVTQAQMMGARIAEMASGFSLSFSAIPAALAPIASIFSTLASSFMTALSPALASLNGGFGGLVTQALALWQSLSPVGILFQALVPYAAQLGQFAGVLVGAFLQLAAAVIPLGLQLASVLIPIISQIVAALLPALGTILGSITAIMPSLVGLVAQAGGAFVALVAAVAPLVVQLVSALLPVIAQIVAAILPALVQIVGAVVAMLPALIPLFTMIAGAVVQVVSALAPLVAELVSSLMPVITQLVTSVLPPVIAIFQALIPPILSLVTAIVSSLVPVIQALLPIVVGVFSGIAQMVTAAMNIVQGIIQVVMGVITGNWGMAWDGIKAVVSGAWELIKGLVTAAIGVVLTVITTVLGAIKLVWDTIWDGIKQFLANTWDGIKSAISTGIDAVKGFIDTGLNAIKGIWDDIWSWVTGFIGDTWRDVKDRVSEGVSDVMDFVRDMPGKIKDALGNVGDFLKESGSALINGFKDGITRGFEKAKDAVKGGLNKIREFFPFSPAKVGPFAGRGYTTFSGKALSRDFADAIAGEDRYLAQRTEDLMSSARFDTPMPTVPAVPDYVPASWSDRHGGDMQQDTQTQAEALAEALRGVQVVMDGRKTVGYLDTVRRT